MKYYIIAGEASGDLHASNLMKGLREVDSQAQFRVWGGDLMQAQGGVVVRHIRDLAFMGVWEVLKNLRTIFGHLALCERDLMSFRPDVLILVDYPGFNLKMARFAHKQGLPTFYYIAPKIWAWKESRIHTIRKFVDRLFVIFPFEVSYYDQHQMSVVYEGNPLKDAIADYLRQAETREAFMARHQLPDKPLIALIPGSRHQELKWILPEMIQLVPRFPGYQFVVSGVPSIERSVYDSLMQGAALPLIFGETYNLMNFAQAAVVTSGTATLETALFGTPQVVVYKTSPVTYAIGRPFVHIEFFSLVNIIMKRQVVKELLQFGLPGDMERELRRLLYDEDYRARMLQEYQTLQQSLGEPGVSRRVAAQMVATLKGSLTRKP
jgi:lipid-A-disaccharide synthase